MTPLLGTKQFIRARRGQVGWGKKSRPVAAFLRVVARHGAAMARHGRPPSPAPATRPVGFSRNTRRDSNHETRHVPHSCGDSKESNPKPGQQVFTKHETRDTNHGFMFPCSRLFTIVHHCSRFGIVRAKNMFPPVSQCPRRRSHRQHDRLGFHETRDTNHGLYHRPVAAFLRLVARHGAYGAAWAAPSPAPATRPVFHETRDMRHGGAFPCGCGGSKESGPVPRAGNKACWVFTSHEHETRPYCVDMSPRGV